MRLFAIPESWRWSTLGSIAAPASNAIVDGPFGSNLTVQDYVDEGVPVLQGKNITGNIFRWSDIRFISHRKAAELARSSVRVGDILTIKKGSIGNSAIVDDLSGHDSAIITANMMKITVDERVAEPRFVYCWMATNLVRSHLLGAAIKTAQPAITLSMIRKLPVPLPGLQEQRRIVKILDGVEALRAKRRAAIALLDVFKDSIFVEIFGDPRTNPNGWPASRLKDFLLMPLRNGLSPSSTGNLSAQVLTLAAVTGNRFDESACKWSTFNQAPPAEQSVNECDLLICRGNGALRLVGRGYFPPRSLPNVTFPDTIIAARIAGEMIDLAYLQHLWNSPVVRLQLESSARTTNGTFKVNQTMLESIDLVTPPRSLQRKFAAVVNQVSSIRAVQETSLAELDALFASLQHHAFRGAL